MGIYNLLYELGEFDYSIFYNGKLSDYVSAHNDTFNETFAKMCEVDPECRLYTSCALNINFENISNKKIGYRDITKLPEDTIKIPYIIYWQQGKTQRAILLDVNTYYEAKGMYYAASEQGNMFEQQKADILGLNIINENQADVLQAFNLMHDVGRTVGSIQRKFDDKYISDIEEQAENSVSVSSEMFAQAFKDAQSAENKEEKTRIIYDVVKRAFLLKKAIYVSYMTSKYMLNQRHGGNVSEQRKFARAYCDEISIIPFYNLWNGNDEESDDDD